MDEALEDINQRQYKTALVINDNFEKYIKSGDLKQPQPNEKLLSKIVADIDYRKNFSISKIKILNTKEAILKQL